jgi:hypothetical protein
VEDTAAVSRITTSGLLGVLKSLQERRPVGGFSLVRGSFATFARVGESWLCAALQCGPQANALFLIQSLRFHKSAQQLFGLGRVMPAEPEFCDPSLLLSNRLLPSDKRLFRFYQSF